MILYKWNKAIPLSLVQGLAKYGAAAVYDRLDGYIKIRENTNVKNQIEKIRC